MPANSRPVDASISGAPFGRRFKGNSLARVSSVVHIQTSTPRTGEKKGERVRIRTPEMGFGCSFWFLRPQGDQLKKTSHPTRWSLAGLDPRSLPQPLCPGHGKKSRAWWAVPLNWLEKCQLATTRCLSRPYFFGLDYSWGK